MALSPANKLIAKPHPGPKCLLNADQMTPREVLLKEGAKPYGWKTRLWTTDRVADLIQRRFAVRFHLEHDRKVLNRRVRATSQKSRRRSRKWDEVAIDPGRRQERSEVIRKARRWKADLVSLDESGFIPTPTVRRTLAPRSRTPIPRNWDRHDRILAIGAMKVRPRRRKLGRDLRPLPDDMDAQDNDIVEVLGPWRRHIPGPMTIVWDRSNVHDRSKMARASLADRPEIVTKKLSESIPVTNPDDRVWEHANHSRLSNFTPQDTADRRAVLIKESGRVHRKTEASSVFIRHAKVSIHCERPGFRTRLA